MFDLFFGLVGYRLVWFLMLSGGWCICGFGCVSSWLSWLVLVVVARGFGCD